MVRTELLIDKGSFSSSPEWASIQKDIAISIGSMEWPFGSGKFTLFDELGKGRGKGNGVKPIKEMFVSLLMGKNRSNLWKAEQSLDIPARVNPGKIDVSTKVGDKLFAVEWETGNISSSHRALNKMALGLLTNVLVGGVLIMPTRKMYAYLTDRVGNFEELNPYFDVWKSLTINDGLLGVIAVEHDAVSKGVPKFRKGTDGRALQ